MLHFTFLSFWVTLQVYINRSSGNNNVMDRVQVKKGHDGTILKDTTRIGLLLLRRS